MEHPHLSSAALRFLDDHITSVAQLELLLLLRTSPDRDWTLDDLVRELRVEAAWAGQQLRYFTDQGLVDGGAPPTVAASEAPTAWRYRPKTDELATSVTALAQAYLLNRVSLIERIYGRPNNSIRALADAFRVRRNPPHG